MRLCQHALFCVTNGAVVTLPYFPVSQFYAITLQLLRMFQWALSSLNGADTKLPQYSLPQFCR
jgi:hypothetical protein